MQVAPESTRPLRELGVGREVQVGEQDVARLEHRDLDRLRLLDLDDHVGLAEDRGGVGDDPRALVDVLGVRDRRALAGALLDEHLVPAVDELADARGRQRDAVLVGLDLGGAADVHAGLLP